jgi:hypothetical protein
LAWPQLEETVSKIPDQAPAEQHSRPQTEILEELVAGVRGLDARMQELVSDMMERGIRSSRSKYRRFHPAMLEEMTELSGDDDPISLLFLAGYVREEMPWLAEMLTELYHEVKNAGPQDREKVGLRARRLMKMLDRGPFFERFIGDSKETYMMVREMPMIVDRIIHRWISRIRPPEEKDEDQREE